MKKVLLLLMLFSAMANYAVADNYDSYLQKAYEQLGQGDSVSAKRYYVVWQKLTQSQDIEFETLLKEMQNASQTMNKWLDDCYIVVIDKDYSLAIQKKSISNKYLKWSDARQAALSSRLGDFVDWRLPSYEEMCIIMQNLPNVSWNMTDYEARYYWTSTAGGTQGAYVTLKYDKSKLEWNSINPRNFIIVRKFKR